MGYGVQKDDTLQNAPRVIKVSGALLEDGGKQVMICHEKLKVWQVASPWRVHLQFN